MSNKTSALSLIKCCMLTLMVLTTAGCGQEEPSKQAWQWEILTATNEPVARHEAGFVAVNDKLFLMGGRRINPTSVFDTTTSTWTNLSPTPIELHHFQPVTFNGKIYIIGALTGPWPNESAVDKVIIYDPSNDTYEYSHTIPPNRRRGGAGAVVHGDKIYIVGGITNGHQDGYKPWFDEYDPKTGEWKVLDDAPDARDHFQAVVVKDKLYAFAGRTSSRRTGEDMSLTTEHGNIYDFTTQQWLPVTDALAIPSQRAGNAAFGWNNEVIVVGGESASQLPAFNQSEAFNVESHQWRNWPTLQRGRHGSGVVIVGNYGYIASGSGNRGGGPELTSIERIKLPTATNNDTTTLVGTSIVQQWHTVTLPFSGPKTTEQDANNPFLNYKLMVEFTHVASQTSITIPGYFAADGNAGESSAEEGSTWQAKFTPNKLGNWQYNATIYQGNNVAIADDYSHYKTVELSDPSGEFRVIRSDKEAPDFRANGRLIASQGYFKFEDSEQYWLKGGANSPENLLGYVDFDGTYRVSTVAREGEAAPSQTLHEFLPHLSDWRDGDPTWQDGKGKALIGAMNYLSDQGMNAVYFLTMNINGDGKDVWPYTSDTEFTRFDVSKLAQWDRVFDYMQQRGILLHVVLQETENELLLDNGDTGDLRKLYINEMIARFGHHLGLVWNLGEENGPADFSPQGQNDAQRKAMASHLKQQDPYNNPVLLHTHSHEPARSNALNPILGFAPLDGLSLQVDKREGVPELIKLWRQKARDSGNEWLITMDEIGMWHTAATPDVDDPGHVSLKRYALWGSLLSGAAGVEWYFGAKFPHNDLTSEDWRQRHDLWQLTRHAMTFFDQYLPYWKMTPCDIADTKNTYCLQDQDMTYAAYFFGGASHVLSLKDNRSQYSVQWYNPQLGGELSQGSITEVAGGENVDLGQPPTSNGEESNGDDWVVLVNKITKPETSENNAQD